MSETAEVTTFVTTSAKTSPLLTSSESHIRGVSGRAGQLSEVPAHISYMNENLGPTARLMNEHEVSEYLGVAVKTLQDWRLDRKHIPYVKVGGRARYRVQDVDAFIEASIVAVEP